MPKQYLSVLTVKVDLDDLHEDIMTAISMGDISLSTAKRFAKELLADIGDQE